MGRSPDQECIWLAERTPQQCRRFGQWVLETIEPQLLAAFEARDVEAGRQLVETTIMEMLKVLAERKFHTNRMDPRLFKLFLIEVRHTKERIEAEIRECREEYRRFGTEDSKEYPHRWEQRALEYIRRTFVPKTTMLKRVLAWGESEGFTLQHILAGRESAQIAHEFLAWRFGRSVKDIGELLSLDRKQTDALVRFVAGSKDAPSSRNVSFAGPHENRMIEDSLRLCAEGYFDVKPADLAGLDREQLFELFSGRPSAFPLSTMGPAGLSDFSTEPKTISIRVRQPE